jgi:hypothetical protein
MLNTTQLKPSSVIRLGLINKGLVMNHTLDYVNRLLTPSIVEIVRLDVSSRVEECILILATYPRRYTCICASFEVEYPTNKP